MTAVDHAALEAKDAIHRHDIPALQRLVAEHPALLQWQGDDDRGGLLGFATGAYGDAFGAEREGWFTRADAAELLIDAGAIVAPSVTEGILDSRAVGLLQLFHRKGNLPRTLNFFAALGDEEAVASSLIQDRHAISEAFIVATNFHHAAVAATLLDRAMALDRDLGTRVESGPGRDAFITYFIEHGAFDRKSSVTGGLWRSFRMRQVKEALTEGDLEAFTRILEGDRWLLNEESITFQADLIGWAATIHDRGEFLGALLDLDPAILHRQPKPLPKPVEWAFEYGHAALLPLLTRIWPLTDELRYAAGLGDIARIDSWFDQHHDTPQHVLDTALAYAVSNKQFAAADALLARGADINTRWNTHEPASLLHHAVFLEDYEILQFLVDRGIDMTIKDYRWDATAQGWAYYALGDKKMAAWLDEAQRRRS